MKREYKKPEVRQFHLLLCSILEGSPTGTNHNVKDEDDPGSGTGIGEDGPNPGNNSRYLKSSMWDEY